MYGNGDVTPNYVNPKHDTKEPNSHEMTIIQINGLIRAIEQNTEKIEKINSSIIDHTKANVIYMTILISILAGILFCQVYTITHKPPVLAEAEP